MKPILLFILFFCSLSNAAAQETENLFLLALKNGKASQEFTENEKTKKITDAMKKQTGSSGPIFITAVRVKNFTQQNLCGRVAYLLEQPSSNTAFSNLGGELNICRDGMPPWRTCKAEPSKLIPPGDLCKDRTAPIDTPEVVQAIAEAEKRGGIGLKELREKIKELQPMSKNSSVTK